MQRHQPGLAELALPDRQHAELEIDVGIDQRKRLGDPHPGARQQTEQRLHHRATRARWRTDPASDLQQRHKLVVAVDVRRHPAGDRTEDRLVGHLGGRLELLKPTRERPQQAQLARPGGVGAGAVLGLPCPGSHHLDRQRAAMAGAPDMLDQALQAIAHRPQIEPEPAPLGQVLLNPSCQGDGPAHDALPGHGSATSTSARVLSLA